MREAERERAVKESPDSNATSREVGRALPEIGARGLDLEGIEAFTKEVIGQGVVVLIVRGVVAISQKVLRTVVVEGKCNMQMREKMAARVGAEATQEKGVGNTTDIREQPVVSSREEKGAGEVTATQVETLAMETGDHLMQAEMIEEEETPGCPV